MSVFDTFYLLFKSEGAKETAKDTKDVKKSADDADKSLKKFSESFEGLKNSVKGVITELAGFVSAGYAVHKIAEGIKSAIDYAINLDNASRALGVNVQALDAWGNAVQRFGGTSEGFQQSLRNLSQRLGTTGDTALRILPQLADGFQHLGRTAAMMYGQSLGLDEKTILLLQQGRREVDSVIQRQKELGLTTKQDAEEARKFNYAWQDMSHSFRSAFMAAAEGILPLLIKVLEGFATVAQFFRKHADLIIGALIGIGVAAALIAAPFIAANAAVIALIAGIGVAIGLFALLYEDIKYFIEGNKSLIGDLLNRWPIVGKVIKGVFDGIKEAIEFVVKAYDKIKDFLNKFTGKKVNIGVNYTEEGGIPDQEDLTKNIQGLNQIIQTVNSSPLTYQTNSSVTNSALANSFFNRGDSNKNVTVNTGAITIETQATDSDEIAATFSQKLTDHIRQSTNTYDNGIQI